MHNQYVRGMDLEFADGVEGQQHLALNGLNGVLLSCVTSGVVSMGLVSMSMLTWAYFRLLPWPRPQDLLSSAFKRLEKDRVAHLEVLQDHGVISKEEGMACSTW
jgi:hypothetical protein